MLAPSNPEQGISRACKYLKYKRQRNPRQSTYFGEFMALNYYLSLEKKQETDSEINKFIDKPLQFADANASQYQRCLHQCHCLINHAQRYGSRSTTVSLCTHHYPPISMSKSNYIPSETKQ